MLGDQNVLNISVSPWEFHSDTSTITEAGMFDGVSTELAAFINFKGPLGFEPPNALDVRHHSQSQASQRDRLWTRKVVVTENL